MIATIVKILLPALVFTCVVTFIAWGLWLAFGALIIMLWGA
jgi:hypothetical protein